VPDVENDNDGEKACSRGGRGEEGAERPGSIMRFLPDAKAFVFRSLAMTSVNMEAIQALSCSASCLTTLNHRESGNSNHHPQSSPNGATPKISVFTDT
jgi:hypothetical protein